MTDTGNSESKRLLIAQELDEQLRAELARASAVLYDSGAHVRWVPESNLHLSLFFIGDTPVEHIEDLKDALDTEATQTKPFEFTVSSVGFFGRRNSPRVVWADVEAVPEMMELQERLSSRLEQLGFKSERRKYKPHITLGRVKSSQNRKELLKALDEFKALTFGTVYNESCVLMESVLGPSGAKYSIAHRSKFQRIESPTD